MIAAASPPRSSDNQIKTPLKYALRNFTQKAPPKPLPFVALEHIQPGLGKTYPGFDWEEAESDLNIAFDQDDILFGKLRPYLAKVLRADRAGCCTSELLVLRPTRVLSRYAYWLMLSNAVVDRAVASSTGVKMPRTRWDRLGREEIELPVETKQRAIADFLDRETARIDALLEKKHRLVELLEAHTWAHFMRLVQESEAESIQLRRAFTFLTDGPFGSAFSSADYSENGAVVVRLGNIGFGEFRDSEVVFIPITMYGSFLRHKVLPGDLLIAGLGDTTNHAGRACVAPDLGPAIVKGKCFCARVDWRVANAHYLALLLSSPMGTQLIGRESRGSTRTMINLDIVKSVFAPLPGVSTQDQIVESTHAMRRQHSLAAGAALRQIALLQEQRQAVITAAVTGQLDIREVA